jgi:hypothetical protein
MEIVTAQHTAINAHLTLSPNAHKRAVSSIVKFTQRCHA